MLPSGYWRLEFLHIMQRILYSQDGMILVSSWIFLIVTYGRWGSLIENIDRRSAVCNALIDRQMDGWVNRGTGRQTMDE